ncbi:MAG: hypothetical protein IPO31_16385 [Candidatus Obscuribacter sp.]|nr:hypothetical protein [Candidatus Obscuribacter sp.]
MSADQGSAPAAAPVEATSGAAVTADADKSGVKPDAAAAVLPVPGAVATAAAPVQSMRWRYLLVATTTLPREWWWKYICSPQMAARPNNGYQSHSW